MSIAMKKEFIGFMVTVAVVLMTFGSACLNSAQAEPVVLKFATVVSPKAFDVQHVWAPIFEKMNKEAEGIFMIEIFAGGTLGLNPSLCLSGAEGSCGT